MLHRRLINALIGLALLLAALSPQPAQAETAVVSAVDPGLSLLKDINPGSNDSIKTLFTSVTQYGDKVFFFANDGVHGLEPWISNGTPGGTLMIKDTFPNGDGVYYKPWAPFGTKPVVWKNSVYYAGMGIGQDNNSVPQLWVSDGTATGTHAVTQDIHAVRWLEGGVQGIMFLDETIGSASNLWWTDGTQQNTFEIYSWKGDNRAYSFKELNGAVYVLNPGGALIKVDLTTRQQTFLDSNSFGDILGTVNGLLFYAKSTPETGRELWQTDGTIQGTQIVADLNPGQNSIYIDGQATVGNSLYFAANLNPGMNNLYKTSGKAGGVSQVASGADLIRYLTAASGLLFYGMGGPGPVATWRSDGTPEGTWPMCETCLHEQIIFETQYGFFTSTNFNFTPLNGSIVYEASDGMGAELWITNGTDDGTHRLGDIYPGPDWSLPNNLLSMNGYIFFTANDGVHGIEPWVYRPSPSRMITRRDKTYIESHNSATIDVMKNDIQLDGKALSLSGFDATSLHGGTITRDDRGTPANLSDDRVIYTPPATLDGMDEFAYWIEDSSGSIAIGRADISNGRPPVLTSPIELSMREDGQQDFPLNWQDPDGDGIDISIIESPRYGSANLFNCNSGSTCMLSYQPIANFFGKDTITVKAEDYHGEFSQATLTIFVQPGNDDPPFMDQPANVLAYQQITSYRRPLTGIAAGPYETDPLTITAATDNPNMLANLAVEYTNGSQGWITFDLQQEAGDSATITVTLNDGVNKSQYTFTVQRTDNPPLFLPLLRR